ncbi:unnamed protein product [Schistosoma turkestanicum]|nr:unnamed protein product [Schistosoma turkestanicum]
MHHDYSYKFQTKPVVAMNQSSNKRQNERACYKFDEKSECRFEEIERKIDKIEEKLTFESNKQTEIELNLKKLINQVEFMKMSASNSMQITKPVSVKRQGCRKTSVNTSGFSDTQSGDQISNPNAFTCVADSTENVPNLLKIEETPNIVYTYINNYLKAGMSGIEKELFGKLDVLFNKIQSLEAHTTQKETEGDNGLTNSEEILLSQDENSSEMSVYSEYQLTLKEHKARLEEMEKLVKRFETPIVNETMKNALRAEVKSRHQQNQQLQKLFNCIIEKLLGVIDKWNPNLNNLEINPVPNTCDLNGSDRSVNESENNNSKLSQLLRLLHKDITDLQTKLENELMKYDEASTVKNIQEPLDFRTLVESILAVKIGLQVKINKLEKQLNLEREKIHNEVVKLREICDRFKRRGDA